MSKTPPYVIGLDIGGTSMVAGVIAAADAQIKSRHTIPTESQHGPEVGLRRIRELLQYVIHEAGIPDDQIGGIGIGCTGPIDTDAGLIQNPHTLPGWDDLPIVDDLTEQFQRPVYMLGDCQVAVLGEQWVGAGQDVADVLYITIGTGIGSGLMLNGRLYGGLRWAAGEVGHHIIDLNGPDCYCGGKGCLEMFAAAPAIKQTAIAEAPADSLLLKLAGDNRENFSARLVGEAAAQGDPFAAALIQRVAYYLGVGVGNLMNILAPEVVILGGGVMGSWPLMAPTLIETVRQRSAMIPFDAMRIVPAALGLNAGITGAARAILEHLAGTL